MSTEIDELRTELAALRAEVAGLRRASPRTPYAEAADEATVSRRGLLGKIAGVAAAGAGMSMLAAAPAEATAGYMRFGETNDAGADQTTLKSSNSGTTLDVWQQGTGICLGADITNTTSSNPVIWARHNGLGNTIDAANINSGNDKAAIYGYGSYNGILGETPTENGVGVSGKGFNGVVGRTASNSESANGVYGIADGGGTGVNAYSNSGTALNCYTNTGVGAAIYAGKAHLLLSPGAAGGPPKTGSHARGEVYVDSNGVHWHCVTAGTPGSWVRPGFNPVTPRRLVSSSTATGSFTAGQQRDITVTGIPAGVSGIALNLTATSTGSSSVTVFTYGTARPGVTHLAVNPQYRWSSAVIVRLGAGSRFSVHNSAGTTKLSIDLAGYFA
jgi:hypothetical protein